MERIYISTSLLKAKDCFGTFEEEKDILDNIILLSEKQNIQKFQDLEVYFHLDISNPDDYYIDPLSDYILKHKETNRSFLEKFRIIEHSSHINEESSLFRQVFKILIFDDKNDKFRAIKSIIFPYIYHQIIGRIGGQFLEIGGIDEDEIKILLGTKYNKCIGSILNDNLVYHQKKSNKSITQIDENKNNANWRVLEDALKASNGC